jgi:hypothetical protein
MTEPRAVRALWRLDEEKGQEKKGKSEKKTFAAKGAEDFRGAVATLFARELRGRRACVALRSLTPSKSPESLSPRTDTSATKDEKGSELTDAELEELLSPAAGKFSKPLDVEVFASAESVPMSPSAGAAARGDSVLRMLVREEIERAVAEPRFVELLASRVAEILSTRGESGSATAAASAGDAGSVPVLGGPEPQRGFFQHLSALSESLLMGRDDEGGDGDEDSLGGGVIHEGAPPSGHARPEPVMGSEGFVFMDEEAADRESDERDRLTEALEHAPEPGSSPFRSFISAFGRIRDELLASDSGDGDDADSQRRRDEIVAKAREMGFTDDDVRRVADFHQDFDGGLEDVVEDLLLQSQTDPAKSPESADDV